jgi:hypothetical protein
MMQTAPRRRIGRQCHPRRGAELFFYRTVADKTTFH